FLGSIDEVDVFNRPLTATEMQAIYNGGDAGKCGVLPAINLQPASQATILGGNVTFSVAATGTPTLTYQWSFNGANLDGATGSSLTLGNVQFSQAGSYAVLVANAVGSVASSNAILTVTPPPSVIQVVNVTAASGIITVPINLIAQGNENALGYSINFDPTLLTFTGINLGSGAQGASLISNTNQIGNGQLGVALALSAGDVFGAGTQELVEVSFLAAAKTNANVAAITFGDQPTLRQVSDSQADVLPASYLNGNVTIPFLGFEGDVSPQPNGDNAVTIIDWVQEGRFVAGLDTITSAGEFQRADCAPRSTLGDGSLTVADWVQVGRYAVGLDPLTTAGGPNQPASGNAVQNPAPLADGNAPVSDGGPIRTVAVVNSNVLRGQACQVSIQLNSQGNENALGFGVNFDPSVLTFTGASPGSGANGATLNVNAGQAGAGKVGLALALPIGASFTSAIQEVAKLKFMVAPAATGTTTVSFSSKPVVQAVAD